MTRLPTSKPSVWNEEENPPVILTLEPSVMTSLSVDEMPRRDRSEYRLSGEDTANTLTVSGLSRTPSQASRSQLPVMPDFSPKSAEFSGPLPRRRIDFM
ncbi:hypothetical protein [Pleomorphomonas sp. JP5]|uniref:hypothetical protein n=1 Tax=Pleomorphomonas sp. JP5 TaxID=2942998 RepID=UPI002044A9D5|nr:hypothetical protein [Pleomorphomonas sp. JP5]MCM5559278.1 hypothetical protein [Pleomorphomonas sp. JP5]